LSNRETKRGGSGSGGESHRVARVEKEIRDVVGTYLAVGFRGALGGFASLTRVRLSADLKIASLNFTMIFTQPDGESPDAFEKRQVLARKEAEKTLNLHAKDFQAELARKLQLRFTPKVTFYYDEGFESALKIEKILRDMSVSAGRGDELPKTGFTEVDSKQDSDRDSDET
jgi:ribosome-binding factor A